MTSFLKKHVTTNYFLFMLCLALFGGGCGSKKESNMAKITVKVVLISVPQRETWSTKFDKLTIWGKLAGSKKSKGRIPKTRFRLRKEIDIERVRGAGVTAIEEELKPGKWKVSVKYQRDNLILGMHKGLGKFEVNLVTNKAKKMYIIYDLQKGFIELSEEETRKKTEEFFLHGQHQLKKIKPPKESEPDYGKEKY